MEREHAEAGGTEGSLRYFENPTIFNSYTENGRIFKISIEMMGMNSVADGLVMVIE